MSEKEWSKQFVKLTVDSASKQVGAVLEASSILFNNIKERTPVGDPTLWHPPYAPPNYVPGTLKASWEISDTNASRNSTTGRFTTTNDMIGNHGIKVLIENTSIYNRQPYAARVEDGWSTQAPQGMLRISCLEWSGIVDARGKSV